MMTEEQIKQMADEYASEYIPMYQKVVKIAFIDGMMKGFEQSRKAITVRNQKINFGFFTFLHQVVHTAIKMYNGDWAWMDYRITFEHNGKRYIQDKGCPCVDCCFFGSDALNRPECMHPYKNNPGGKGVCNGLVYKEERK